MQTDGCTASKHELKSIISPWYSFVLCTACSYYMLCLYKAEFHKNRIKWQSLLRELHTIKGKMIKVNEETERHGRSSQQ